MTLVPKSHALRWITPTLAAFLLAQTASRAQISIFLKVADIVGESKDTVYKDASIADNWSWGIQTAIDPLTRTTRSTFSSLSIAKPVDSATPKLMTACAQGKHYDRATLIMRKSGRTPIEFYRITLEDVLVSSVQDSGSSGGDIPYENLTLSYARIGVEYFQITPVDSTVRFEFAWDIANNKQGGVTFPTTTDADADQLPDAWERQFGLDTAKNDADLDNDSDGATNFEEYIAGTSPINADQVLRAKLDLSPAGATFTMPTVPGKTYRILTSPDIAAPFQLFRTIQATAETTTLPTTFDFPTQYFKIEVLP
jgi:type VI secretion system secreted protein Hcp